MIPDGGYEVMNEYKMTSIRGFNIILGKHGSGKSTKAYYMTKKLIEEGFPGTIISYDERLNSLCGGDVIKGELDTIEKHEGERFIVFDDVPDRFAGKYMPKDPDCIVILCSCCINYMESRVMSCADTITVLDNLNIEKYCKMVMVTNYQIVEAVNIYTHDKGGVVFHDNDFVVRFPSRPPFAKMSYMKKIPEDELCHDTDIVISI